MTYCCNGNCNQGRDCPERSARMADDFETFQGRAQPMTWDDLPFSFRFCLVVIGLGCAVVLIALAGMLILAVMAGAADALANPLAGNPYQ